MDRSFSCQVCGKAFTLGEAVLARYPGWTPRHCRDHRAGARAATPSRTRPDAPSLATSGPDTGVFTDGCCEHNPGPGGWGAVKVVAGSVVEERHGHDPETTNNRMELRALIEGYKMVQPEEELSILSDSELCVKTINEWAAAWERNGWRRGKKREPVLNLDLVQELYALARSRPYATLEWIRGHNGARWNEYADLLSRRYQQDAVLTSERTNNEQPTTNNRKP